VLAGRGSHPASEQRFQEGDFLMAAIAFTDAQLEQISAMATQIPRRLRDAYLRRVVELLHGRDFGDGDVHRAASNFQFHNN
jgi:hypothetical protein